MNSIRKLLNLFLIVSIAFPAMAEEEPEKKKRRSKKTSSAQAARLPKWPDPNLKITLPPLGNKPQVTPSTQLWLERDWVNQGANLIDQAVAKGLAKKNTKPNAPASDEVFVRRIYLDAIGRIPSPEEARTFLESKDPAKRAKLIDSLLISDGFRSHQFNWLADMLRHKSSIKRAAFHNYERWLKDQIATNRKWDGLVSDLLTAKGTLASNGPTGYLLRDPGMPLDNLSNTLTIFLGANVSCAQCHDHPLAEWTQKEFYQMASFFGATYVSDRDPRKIAKGVLGQTGPEKAMLVSVMAQSMNAVHQLPKQNLAYPDDYAYDDAKPGKLVKPGLIQWENEPPNQAYNVDLQDVQQLRQSFASWLTHPENPRFSMAIANRLWKKAFGIAVQEPVEDLDDLSLASNPELIKELGRILVLLKFDLREFQRVIYYSQAYQAEANVTPDIGDIDKYPFPGPVLRRMTAEQAWDSILTLVVGSQIDQTKVDRSHHVTRFDIPYDHMTVEGLENAVTMMQKQGYMKKMKNRKSFPNADLASGPKPPPHGNGHLLRASEMIQPSRDEHFLRIFGQSSRMLTDDGSLEGSIPQALMLMNGTFQGLLSQEGSALMEGVDKKTSRQEKIEEMYMSFYSRNPSDDETKRLQQALKDGTTISSLAWVLFNTPEFIFIQ